LEWWGLGGIYTPQPPTSRWGGCCRWAHRTVRCASHVTQPLGFWSFWPLEALSSTGTGQSGAAPDRHCSVSGAPLTLRFVLPPTIAHCSSALHLLQATVARTSRCSAGAPDSPVAHRTIRWIIAERGWRNPRVASSALYGPSAPNTVRWHTGQSGAPDQGTLSFFAPLNLNPNFNLLLVCVEPLCTCRTCNLEQTS
jgi:hypothetical protein